MSRVAATSLAVGAGVLGAVLGASGIAIAQFGMEGPGSQLGMPYYMKADTTALAELGNNEGVYVDRSTFKLHMGKPKAVPETAKLQKGAHEVANGAIIYRSAGKLYLIDAKPAVGE